MKPTQNTPLIDLHPHAAVSLELFTYILKKTVLHLDQHSTQASMEDVHYALQFFEDNDASDSLAMRRQKKKAAASVVDPETREAFATVLATAVPPDCNMTFGLSVHPVVTELLAFDNLRLRFPDMWLQHRSHRLFDHLHQAALSVPGQADAAQAVAVDLTRQLNPSERQVAARLLIHGEMGAGGTEMANALARSLVVHEGYQCLNIDCANYRGSGEVTAWIGAKPVWSGSGPGEVTAFIHKHPKAVIVFHHLDETLPRVMAVLRSALTQGEMTDAYGLNDFGEAANPKASQRDTSKLQPTVVNCRQAVFIFTASHGTAWLRHPDAAHILGDSARQQRNNLLQALRDARQKHRDDEMAVFDATVLAELKNHHHLLQPVGWQTLLAQAQLNMPKVLALARTALGQDLRYACPQDEHALAALALWQQGGDMGLAHTKPEALFDALVKGLQALRLAGGAAAAARADGLLLGLTDAARHQWATLQQRLGSDPMKTLRQRSEYVALRFAVHHDGGAWLLDQADLKPVRRLSDFTGVGGLITAVPTETLDDVCGHEAEKAVLREITRHLTSPQLLAAHGLHPPRGVLLYGPPGTGKTLLARGLAGTAQLPFISVSGSDLLSTGAAQRLFEVAYRNAPCVVFLDEIDVLGKRGQQSHAHDVAITLLLTNLDGFHQRSGVFYVLSSNRSPDTLDAALTRSGRIDRALEISALDVAGRKTFLERLWSLLEVPEAGLPVARQRVLNLTYGMTGAELTQLHRELVLRLVRERHGQPKASTKLSMPWVVQEINRIKHGEMNVRPTDETFRHRLALHEAGHALLHHLLLRHAPIAQVSIVPRNGSAGFLAANGEGVQQVEETAAAVRAVMTVLLGGRAAEIMVFGKDGPSGGASHDLARATKAAFQAVAFSGLDDEFGSASLLGLAVNDKLPPGLHEVAAARAMAWVEQSAATAMQLLLAHRSCLEALVTELLAHETLEGADIARIVLASSPAAAALPKGPSKTRRSRLSREHGHV